MNTSKQLPHIKPLASMEEAWAERTRMRAEGDRMMAEGDIMMAGGNRMWIEGSRMWTEGDLIVILTAQSLYGEDVEIDLMKRVVIQKEESK